MSNAILTATQNVRFGKSTQRISISYTEANTGVTVSGNTFSLADAQLYLVQAILQAGGLSDPKSFLIDLYDETAGTVIQSFNGQANAFIGGSDVSFVFSFTSVAGHRYSIRITAQGSGDNDNMLTLASCRTIIQGFGTGSGGPISGSGTANTLAKFTAATSIGNSSVTDDGTTITANNPLSIVGTSNANTFLNMSDGQADPVSVANNGRLRFNAATEKFEISENTGAWTTLTPTGGGIGGSGAAGQAAFFTASQTLSSTSNFAWDNTNKILTLTALSGGSQTALIVNPDASQSVSLIRLSTDMGLSRPAVTNLELNNGTQGTGAFVQFSSQPISAYSNTAGTAGNSFSMRMQDAGAALTSSAGKNAGQFTFATGAGSNGDATSGNNAGGNAGNIQFTGAAGGTANLAANGGNGTSFQFTGGAGGTATGTGGLTGGAGGGFTINLGPGGAGTTTNGANGLFIIAQNGTNCLKMGFPQGGTSGYGYLWANAGSPTSGNYFIAAHASNNLLINAPSSQNITFSVNTFSIVKWTTSTWDYYPGSSTKCLGQSTSSISAVAGVAATAGNNWFTRIQDGGTAAASSAGVNGGSYTWTGGAGSNGDATSGNNAGGNAGNFIWTGANGGTANLAANGGSGSSYSFTAGNGGAASGAGGLTGGAGGTHSWTGGNGGNGTTTGGAGGGFTWTAGNAGSGGNVSAGMWTFTAGTKTGTGNTSGFRVPTGGNGIAGTGTLSGNPSIATISTTAVTASSIIIVTWGTLGGTAGTILRVRSADITAGTSFIVRSETSAGVAATADTSTFYWWLVN